MPAFLRPRVRLVPTGYGLAYLASAVTLLAVAVLYNNNLCFILAFLVLSIMVAAVPAALSNARGVRVLGVRCEPAYAGGRASYSVAVRLGRNRTADVALILGDSRTGGVVPREETAHLKVEVPAPHRGWLDPGPGIIMTEYPLGLFRASFRVRMPPCLVYPHPLAGAEAVRSARNAGERSRADASGTEDFRDLTAWRPGDPLSRIAWKASARGQGLQTKVFDTLIDPAPVFDWHALEGNGELRLSRLCHLVLEASRAGLAFGLRLPGTELPAARGRDIATGRWLLWPCTDPLEPTVSDVRPRNVQAVIMVFALALAPLVLDLPAWVTVWCLVLWSWALAVDKLGWRQPPGWLRLVLLVGGMAGAMVGYFPYRLWQLGFASSALAVLLGVKAMELSTTRNRMTALFLAYFLVVTKLLDTITLEMAVYALAVVFLSTAAMVRLNSPLSRRGALAAAGGILLRALPLAVALFLFFPRSDVGLSWRFGLARSTGFSEKLSPGDLTTLVYDTTPAFRASFHGPVPPQNQLYWRGVVLWDFNGRTWQGRPQGSLFTSSMQALSTVDYTLTMEPHWRPWVFALDAPVAAPDGLWLSSDLSLSVRRVISSRRTFRLRSAVERHTGPPLRSDARAGQLPKGVAPETLALGRSWAEQGLLPEEALEAAMKLLRTGGFAYSLTPSPISGDPTDGFLFGTRNGYCGHYASAMALLLRAAGVPTRLVLGYQGGETNPLGGFLTVRQSDAHAWCEVLLPGRGWVRFDPTAVVAPARTNRGARAMLVGGQNAAQEGWGSGPLGRMLNELSMAWDSVRYRLDPWITDLGPDAQSDLFSKLGLRQRGWGGRLAILAGAVGLGLALALLWPWLGRRRGRMTTAEKAHRVYLRYCARLARTGLPRSPWQGPLDYAAMVSARRPDLADRVTEVAAVYSRLRYGEGDSLELDRLRHLVRK